MLVLAFLLALLWPDTFTALIECPVPLDGFYCQDVRPPEPPHAAP